MSMNKSQYIGKKLTWDEAVKLFPDFWVAFSDCTYDGVSFKSGVLVDVISDDEISDYMCKHWNEKLHIDRTTEESTGGYIHGKLIAEAVN